MTQEHTITPPPELIAKWAANMCGYYEAARWGADQELEACCEWANATGWEGAGDSLRSARRPKPPSLKEQGIAALDEEQADMSTWNYKLIRSVLESLPD